MSEPTNPLEDPGAEPQASFGVVRDDRPGAVVLAVQGDVDTVTAPKLTDAAVGVLAEGPPVLVLDLTRVDFLASPGLTSLLTVRRNAGETALRIVAAGRASLRPIQLTGLDQSLPLYPTLEAALAG